MQYLITLEFILIGIAGLVVHYLEKRYWHNTTKATFRQYIFLERDATAKAFGAMCAACYAVATAHTGGYMPEVSELVACIGAGYGFDNALNKAHDEHDPT